MTDKQILVLNKIVETAKAVTGIAFVGLYPDALAQIGQRFPAVVVYDGNEDAPNYDTGQQVRYEYTVELALYHEVNGFKNRIQDVLSLQNKLITSVITDLTLSGTVLAVLGHSVDKGYFQGTELADIGGYQGEVSKRLIKLRLQIKDSRN